jgi:hypothetical protein
MSVEKIGPQHGGALCPLVLGPSGAAQLREPGAAVRHARSSPAARLVASRGNRRGPRVFGRGRSAGFERMVAEVCLGNVGAVAAREVSRFARYSRDWQRLVEMCRVVDTLLIDQEAVYAPRQGNDRLLLGLKGSLMSTSPVCCASARSRRAMRRRVTARWWCARRGTVRNLVFGAGCVITLERTARRT